MDPGIFLIAEVILSVPEGVALHASAVMKPLGQTATLLKQVTSYCFVNDIPCSCSATITLLLTVILVWSAVFVLKGTCQVEHLPGWACRILGETGGEVLVAWGVNTDKSLGIASKENMFSVSKPQINAHDLLDSKWFFLVCSTVFSYFGIGSIERTLGHFTVLSCREKQWPKTHMQGYCSTC